MVVGIDVFKGHFANHNDQYVIIGGSACEQWFFREGLRFRATKDIDIVLTLHPVSDSFISLFWDFIRKGEYSANQKSSQDNVYYRFSKPGNYNFPSQIEIFSIPPNNFEIDSGHLITPIPAGGSVSSLSAILMDENYYELIKRGKELVDGLPLVNPEMLLPLKAKAWLDLQEKREAGENVRGDDIKKHRNDVFRLAHLLPAGGEIPVPAAVDNDLKLFVAQLETCTDEWDAIIASVATSIPSPTPIPDLLKAISGVYQ